MCLLRVLLLPFFNRNTTYVILLFFRIERNFPRNCLQMLKDSVYPCPTNTVNSAPIGDINDLIDWIKTHTIVVIVLCIIIFLHVTAFVIKLLWKIQIFIHLISFKPKSRPLGHFSHLSCIHSRLLCYTNLSCCYTNLSCVFISRESGADAAHLLLQHGLPGLAVPLPQRHGRPHPRLYGEYPFKNTPVGYLNKVRGVLGNGEIMLRCWRFVNYEFSKFVKIYILNTNDTFLPFFQIFEAL